VECALEDPAECLPDFGEVAAREQTLDEVTEAIAHSVAAEGGSGENYGIVLIPEGLVEFIPEIKSLDLRNSTTLLAMKKPLRQAFPAKEKANSCEADPPPNPPVDTLPEEIQGQLLADRDPTQRPGQPHRDGKAPDGHGAAKLAKWGKTRGKAKAKFSPAPDFFGYRRRGGQPVQLRQQLCYALGTAAAIAVAGAIGPTG